ncbi:hypothetical protein D3C73_1290900 [compost metagenome]
MPRSWNTGAEDAAGLGVAVGAGVAEGDVLGAGVALGVAVGVAVATGDVPVEGSAVFLLVIRPSILAVIAPPLKVLTI